MFCNIHCIIHRLSSQFKEDPDGNETKKTYIILLYYKLSFIGNICIQVIIKSLDTKIFNAKVKVIFDFLFFRIKN